MNKFRASILGLVALVVAACGGTPSPVIVAPTVQAWTISNSSVQVTASAAFGAAVISVIDKHGNQYVDTFDHGREFQTAYQLDGQGEGYNPTEAGSAANGQGRTSSTTIVSAAITSANVFESTVHPAFWNAYNGGIVSPDTIAKKITVGYAGRDNVLRWDVSITLAEDHLHGYFEGLTGYGPNFPGLYAQQPDGAFALVVETTPAPWLPGALSTPIIESAADGSQAIGAYAPGYLYANTPNILGVGVDKWDCAWWEQAPLPAGVYSYTCYVAVGTLAEVEAALVALEQQP